MISVTSSFIDDLNALQPADVSRIAAALAKLQQNPRHPGLQTKKMEGCDLYEVRASQDLRIIASLFDGDPVCCIADHHDAALRRALLIGRPTRSTARHDISAYESQKGATAALLKHLSDYDLKTEYGVPAEWIEILRSAPSSDAILNSGIDEVIGIERTLRLSSEIRPGPDEIREIRIVRGDMILHAVNSFAAADLIEQAILISPSLVGFAKSREFFGLIDLLRSRKVRTLVVTRRSDAPEHLKVANALSQIPTSEVLFNDAIGMQIVACLAPTPWGFGGLGSATGLEAGNAALGVFVPSRVGEDRAIKQLASIAMDVRTSIDTERYLGARS